MRNGIDSLFSCLSSEDDKYFILATLFDSTTVEIENKKKLPIDIVEEIIIKPNSFVDNLSNHYKAALYTYYIGKSFDDLERYDDAIEYYDKAIGLDPNSKEAWNNKAWTLGGLGKYKEAIECYDKALDIDPNDTLVLINKAYTLNSLGEYNEAKESCNEALDIDPNNFYAFNNKGLALTYLGEYKEAIECYDKALDIDPNPKYGTVFNNKGLALTYLGEYKEAIECYDKALDIDPIDTDALTNKNRAREKQEKKVLERI